MGTTMPPVLESLQTVFPDISLQPLSHEAFSTTGGADHSPSSTLVHQDYSNRIGSINAKVGPPQGLAAMLQASRGRHGFAFMCAVLCCY